VLRLTSSFPPQLRDADFRELHDPWCVSCHALNDIVLHNGEIPDGDGRLVRTSSTHSPKRSTLRLLPIPPSCLLLQKTIGT